MLANQTVKICLLIRSADNKVSLWFNIGKNHSLKTTLTIILISVTMQNRCYEIVL